MTVPSAPGIARTSVRVTVGASVSMSPLVSEARSVSGTVRSVSRRPPNPSPVSVAAAAVEALAASPVSRAFCASR
ncbi:hypothetical protein ABZX77_22380 [Streptomyces sp. NPDC004237]|uniref:hypothetical protein n=1 Tax=Streptomyces sp. NPDC004237 TaxID=3154455 RepID=UPI0033B5AC7A